MSYFGHSVVRAMIIESNSLIVLTFQLLQKEVGEGTTVQSILANPNSWRGRSEQIAVLQNKLSNLKADETPPSRMEQKRQRDIKNLEKNRKKQLQVLEYLSGYY